MTGYVGSIEKATLNNSFFRQVLFTGKYSQLVVMCLQPNEEIGERYTRTSISSSALKKELPNSSSMAGRNTSSETVTRLWCLPAHSTTC
ncbi:MAG: hypothetical protein FD174_2288 [Geobacteraceae bacterium]|nr:MAG: hypothetical protein FD174_2288 [Geobacteraceae bacterium]